MTLILFAGALLFIAQAFAGSQQAGVMAILAAACSMGIGQRLIKESADYKAGQIAVDMIAQQKAAAERGAVFPGVSPRPREADRRNDRIRHTRTRTSPQST